MKNLHYVFWTFDYAADRKEKSDPTNKANRICDIRSDRMHTSNQYGLESKFSSSDKASDFLGYFLNLSHAFPFCLYKPFDKGMYHLVTFLLPLRKVLLC